ncbi:sugar transferase [Alkaliflexus imshenetskii]|uniref:sugar transferase n=1 Tax=Alkaliflexus imshenetskii TaxID=286730 RepID=UPI0004B15B14|nr:sugar transferase [Alkaliflexus imshenetskii]
MSQKSFKTYFPGSLAIAADYIIGLALLINVPSLIDKSGLNSISLAPYINFTYLIPAALVFLFSMFGSYKQHGLTIGHVSTRRPIIALTMLFISLFIIISYASNGTYSPPRYLLKLLVVTGIFSVQISISRLIIHLLFTSLLKKGVFTYNVLIVMHNLPEAPYLKEILRYIEVNNLTLTGYCGTEKFKIDSNTDQIVYLGKYKDAPEVVKTHDIDEVIILKHSQKSKQTEKILLEIDTAKVLIRMAPGTIEPVSGRLGNSLTELPVVAIQPRNMNFIFRIVKRVFDLCCAVIGLLMTILIYPYFAYRIKKDSEGPVLYKQERIGKKGRPFMLYKFRTMYTDAEKSGPQLAEKDNDPRITPFGIFLRRNHLDELPQFWNVIKGDMSLVGPRPERAYYANQLAKEEPYYHFITQVKPGLTSLGMVKYGYAHNLEQMTERMVYDIAYINNHSILTDLQIIAGTIVYLLKRIFFRNIPKEQRSSSSVEMRTSGKESCPQISQE